MIVLIRFLQLLLLDGWFKWKLHKTHAKNGKQFPISIFYAFVFISIKNNSSKIVACNGLKCSAPVLANCFFFSRLCWFFLFSAPIYIPFSLYSSRFLFVQLCNSCRFWNLCFILVLIIVRLFVELFALKQQFLKLCFELN